MKNPKPRVRFCWECGRQLRGNHHEEKEYHGHLRIFHKQCWKDVQRYEGLSEVQKTKEDLLRSGIDDE